MATFTVTTTGDVVDADDGVLSLREALARADRSDEADTILFSDSVQGRTIVLAGSQLTVASDVTIDGGSGVTIDADGRSRVLLVEETEDERSPGVTLAHLTITGGRTRGEDEGGAGICGDGQYSGLDLEHVIVTGNRAAGSGGGIAGFYDVSLSNSIVADNRAVGSGGGISGFYVSLRNSTVSGNEVRGRDASGGGIDAGEHVWVINSTVSDNSSIGRDASGGGAFGNHVIVRDSTVSGNDALGAGASGGGIAWNGYARLYSATVSGNRAEGAHADGGGIDATYACHLYNSIVAGNGTTGAGAADILGTVDVSGSNIFGSEVQGSAPGDRQNVAPEVLFATIDPHTGGGLLADNGGPTQTIALRDDPSNPALGRAVSAAAPDTDQRGETRPAPSDTLPDIGAFELDQSNPSPPPAGTTFLVTTTSDVTADDGQLTLREALALADADKLSRDRIEFAAPVQGQTIILGGSQLTASSDVTIDGGAGVAIDADQASRVLLVQGFGTDVLLQHLTITGGRTAQDSQDHGGGILADRRVATLSLDHTTVCGNSAADFGGGIFTYTSLTLTDSTVSGNTGGSNGGGIYGLGSVTLTNSTVSGNSTPYGFPSCGGIRGYSVTLMNSIVAGNHSGGLESDVQAQNTISNGHNIFGTQIPGAAAGDLQDVSASALFAALDPTTGGGELADNGGPTPTIALRDDPSNPALGGADPWDAPATDQRGVARPSPGGTDPDIGAFEHPWLQVQDGLDYIASYGDLIGALGTDAAAGASHYRAYGAAEGRQVSFDGLEYIASYEDLIAALGADRNAGSTHFIDHGAAEGRQVTFDGLQYIASHDDLIAALGADADAGAEHYIRFGAGEHRPQDEFDAEQYLANYADLQAAFGSDTEAATAHYIRYGHAEGRRDEPLTQAAADFLL